MIPTHSGFKTPKTVTSSVSSPTPKTPPKMTSITTVLGSPPDRVMSQPFEALGTPFKSPHSKRSISLISENTELNSSFSRGMSRLDIPLVPLNKSTSLKKTNPSISENLRVLGSPPRTMSQPAVPQTPTKFSYPKASGSSDFQNMSVLGPLPRAISQPVIPPTPNKLSYSNRTNSVASRTPPATPVASRTITESSLKRYRSRSAKQILFGQQNTNSVFPEEVFFEPSSKKIKIEGSEAKSSIAHGQITFGRTQKSESSTGPKELNFIENAQVYHQSGHKNFIQKLQEKHPNVAITSVEGHEDAVLLGKGQFVNAYLVNWNEKPQVIKIWHFENAQVNYSKAILAREVSHYHQLKQLGIPVADHYNMDTLANDVEFLKLLEVYQKSGEDTAIQTLRQLMTYLPTHFMDGFYRTEYLPDSFLKLEELEGVAIDKELFEMENHPLFQLKKILQSAYTHSIPIDIRLENLRLKEGILKLIDLQPEDQGEKEVWGDNNNAFEPLLKVFLKKISKSNPALSEYLDPRLGS